MPMSEDAASAALSMAGKTVSGTVDITLKTLDALIRLLHEISVAAEKRAERKDTEKQRKMLNKETNVVKKDLLQSLKMKGQVSIKDLRDYTAKSGENLVYSEQGLTKDDVSLISKNAKAMGMPIAFSRAMDKKTYYPVVSAADAQPFKIMLQDIIKGKLNEDRQKPVNEREYCQLAVAKWELPFISQECQRLDIQGSFAPHPTERNQIIFVYHKQDEQSAMSIIDQIEKSCNDLKNIQIKPDSEGYVEIKDSQTGRTYSFDTSNTSEEVLINELQDKLGFDSMKARLTAAKFENECLTADQIAAFKENDPHNAFYSFGELYNPDPETGKENPITEPYKMGYYVCKYDEKPCFTISNPQGKAAVFSSNEITPSKIRMKLKSELGIQNKDLLLALTNKVHQCSRMMAKDNMLTELSFVKSDFNLSDPQIASGMRRTDASGKVFVKKQPLESVSLQIARKDASSFTVSCSAQAQEFDETGNASTSTNTRELELSLIDEKKSYESIRKSLVAQGVPPETAKSLAKDTIEKARSQPSTETVYVERMTATSVVCFTNTHQAAEIPVQNGQIAPQKLKDAFSMPDDSAQRIASQIQSEIVAQNVVNAVSISKSEFEKHKLSQNDCLASAHQNRDDGYIESVKTVSIYQKDGSYFRSSITTTEQQDLDDIERFDEISEKQAMSDIKMLQSDSDWIVDSYAEESVTDNEVSDIEVSSNGHELHPEGNLLAEQSDALDSGADIADSVSDTIGSIVSDDDDDSISMGAM